MNRKSLIAGGALALTLAALLAVPAWLGAAESSTEEKAAVPATRGYLGVGLRELTPELQVHFGAPEGSGVLVASVDDSSPAATAGIRVGDVITAVDGLAVDSARDLSREIRHRPDEVVTIELYRDAQLRQLTATLGEKEARHWGPSAWSHGAWSHGGRSPEEWEELGERWERWGEEFGQKWERWGEEFGQKWEKWGEEFGERWGEEFGQRWGEEFAQRWGEEHADSWQRWAEEMAERGEGWEKMGEEIGRTVEKALADVDWEQIGRSVEESMKALEGLDWEEIGAEIERHMEEVGKQFHEQHETDSGTE